MEYLHNKLSTYHIVKLLQSRINLIP